MDLELALWVQYGSGQREGWEMQVASYLSKVTSGQSRLEDQLLDIDMFF